jgi:hypothetical protein
MRSVLLVLASVFVSACWSSPTSIGAQRTVGSGATLIPSMPSHVTTFQRWEHLCLSGGAQEEVSARIAEAGDKGWEMVSFGLGKYDYVACFKRPKPPPAGAQAPATAPSPASAPPTATPPAASDPHPGPGGD